MGFAAIDKPHAAFAAAVSQKISHPRTSGRASRRRARDGGRAVRVVGHLICVDRNIRKTRAPKLADESSAVFGYSAPPCAHPGPNRRRWAFCSLVSTPSILS